MSVFFNRRFTLFKLLGKLLAFVVELTKLISDPFDIFGRSVVDYRLFNLSRRFKVNAIAVCKLLDALKCL